MTPPRMRNPSSDPEQIGAPGADNVSTRTEPAAQSPLIPELGQRVLIVGATGSGKTGLACWILKRIPQSPIVIYDTKIEEKFMALPHSLEVNDFEQLHKEIEKGEHDYYVFRPRMDVVIDPGKCDELLIAHYHTLHGVPAYIDEIYQFHKGSYAGPGLMGLLTRGRSKGITTIMSTQRPKFLSRFALTEAQAFYVLRLNFISDRKVFDDAIPNFSELPIPQKFGFYFARDNGEKPVLYAPVKLDSGIDIGYTDVTDEPAETPISAKHSVWI